MESVGGGAVSMVPTTLMNAASAAFAGITTRWTSGARGSALPRPRWDMPGTPDLQRPWRGGDRRSEPLLLGRTHGEPRHGRRAFSGSMTGASIGIDGELPGLPALLGAAANFSTSQMQEDGTSAQAQTSFGSFSLYGIYQAGPAYVSADRPGGLWQLQFRPQPLQFEP